MNSKISPAEDVSKAPLVRRIVLFAALVCLVLSPGAEPSALDPDKCYRSYLGSHLQWVTYGEWSRRESYMFVVDAFRQEVLELRPDGSVTIVARNGGPQPEQPVRIRCSTAGECFVQDSGNATNSIYRFDGLQYVGTPTPIGGRQSIEGHELRGIFEWVPLGDGFVIMGDIVLSNGSWESAIGFISREGSDFEIFRFFSTTSPARPLFLKIRSFTALDEKTAFLLLLNESPPQVGKLVLGHNEIVTHKVLWPESFGEVPDLPRMKHLYGSEEATEHFKRIENARMPAGIFSFDGRLYILVKESINASRETSWTLVQVDTNDGKEISRAPLATETAAHLAVVPGSHWTFIEKDPVEPIGMVLRAPYMDTDEMLMIPNDWISKPTDGPLTDSKKTFLCD